MQATRVSRRERLSRKPSLARSGGDTEKSSPSAASSRIETRKRPRRRHPGDRDFSVDPAVVSRVLPLGGYVMQRGSRRFSCSDRPGSLSSLVPEPQRLHFRARLPASPAFRTDANDDRFLLPKLRRSDRSRERFARPNSQHFPVRFIRVAPCPHIFILRFHVQAHHIPRHILPRRRYRPSLVALPPPWSLPPPTASSFQNCSPIAPILSVPTPGAQTLQGPRSNGC